MNKKECSLKNVDEFLKKGDSALQREYEACKDSDARFFVQYMCKQSPQDLATKTEASSTCIYIAIIAGITVMLVAELGKQTTKKMTKRHD